jgi:hypothetical protein
MVHYIQATVGSSDQYRDNPAASYFTSCRQYLTILRYFLLLSSEQLILAQRFKAKHFIEPEGLSP